MTISEQNELQLIMVAWALECSASNEPRCNQTEAGILKEVALSMLKKISHYLKAWEQKNMITMMLANQLTP